MDLKVYCTQDMYDNYRQGGILYACLPKTRNKLFADDSRQQHDDLNIKLSLSREKHKIEKAPNTIEGWYRIWKN